MGLVLVCPQCQAKVDLSAQTCQYCQADLRHLPKDQRLYVIGRPGPPEVQAAAAIPVLASAEVPATVPTSPGRVRRPYIRRYAGSPVAATHPSTLTASAPAAAAMPSRRVRRPYIRRYAAAPVSATHPTTLGKPPAAPGKAEAKKTKKTKATTKKKK
ncbi:MAG: hypothetical protein ACUVRZ_11115 [Desulfobacca sp.]|uniref:hypothetical protein n=1 Tax=Desulfobacca sp. TaxID=2067990 RepID=UPI00404953E1